MGFNNTTSSNQSTYITIDRCYFHALDEEYYTTRALGFDVSYGAVINCYIDNIKADVDNQGVWAYNTSGPILIYNNFIEACGMNIFFGGADNQASDLIPSDITITKNYLFKRLSWDGAHWNCVNVIESKMAKRVLVEGNVIQNCWADVQDNAIRLKSENQGGNNNWAESADWTIRYNKILNVSFGINITPKAGAYTSVAMERVNFHDNLFMINTSLGNGIFLQNLTVNDTIVNHNTVINDVGNRLVYLYESSADGFDFINNITVDMGTYGIKADGSVAGTASLNAAYPGGQDSGWSCTKNAAVGWPASGYPSQGVTTPENVAAIQFVNYQADGSGDYHLDSGSPYLNAGTDSEDLGADIDLLNAAIEGVIEGNPGDGEPPIPATMTGIYRTGVTSN